MTNVKLENERLLEIVNEQDEVIGNKPRNDVHLHGLLHREVNVWLFDVAKNIFFQKAGLHRPSAGMLDASVGGHVNKGESYLEAALREAKEETGISLSASDMFLLAKLRQNMSEDGAYSSGKSNNVIKSVFIYKNPIKEEKLRKEAGIPGGGFKKISLRLFSDPTYNFSKMIHPFVLKDQLPIVLKYLNNND